MLSGADTDEDAPTTTADGLPIVATSIAGGLSIKNETDIAVDAAALLQQGPAVTLPAGEPQILIMHTHASEAFTPAGRDLYPASDTCRTEDTNYNIVHVGDVLADTLEAAGLQVLHDRTIYDYPSYNGSYNSSNNYNNGANSGSGCGCSASVLCGHILQRMTCGDWPRVLFAATGALMSPTTSQQGESIPGICHAVVLDVNRG